MDQHSSTTSKDTGLRRDGGVLLVSCYEQGHQPLGLAAPLGVLRAAGFRPRAVDVAVEDLPEEVIDAACLVAISTPMHTALRIGAGVADRVHGRHPEARIVFFGDYAWLNREHLFERHHAGWVVGGECETPLRALAEALAAGTATAALEGVTSPENREPPLVRRSPVPAPDRQGLPGLDHYVRLDHRGTTRLVGSVASTSGCKHTCTHCPLTPIYRGRFFAVPVDTVAKDIDAHVAGGAEHITFADPDFLNGPTHALRVARALHAAHPDLGFDFTAKVEHLVKHADLLPELVETGALFVVSAVESLSEDVLRKLRKDHTRADVARALEATRAAGLTLRPTLLPFTPWATLDDYLDLIAFVESHDLIDAVDPIQLAVRLLVPPGSALLEEGSLDPYLTGLAPDRLAHTWEHPDPRMDGLQARVMAIVREGVEEKDGAERTFARIAAAARETAGLPRPGPRVTPRPRREKAPRLTEPWFC